MSDRSNVLRLISIASPIAPGAHQLCAAHLGPCRGRKRLPPALSPFGPRQDYDSENAGVVARFCKAVLSSHPITIYGDGKQLRDFTYIDNVISASLLVAAAPEDKVAGRIFDCASGSSVSVLELADALADLTGRPAVQRLEASRVGDIRDSRADISAIERELGYRVLVSWKEGLRRTLDSYRLEGETVRVDSRSPLRAGLQEGF